MSEESYEEACKRHTTNQGLDPIIKVLEEHDVEFMVQQTGGFTMVVVADVPNGTFGFTSGEVATGDQGAYVAFYPRMSWENGGEEVTAEARDVDDKALSMLATFIAAIQEA